MNKLLFCFFTFIATSIFGAIAEDVRYEKYENLKINKNKYEEKIISFIKKNESYNRDTVEKEFDVDFVLALQNKDQARYVAEKSKNSLKIIFVEFFEKNQENLKSEIILSINPKELSSDTGTDNCITSNELADDLIAAGWHFKNGPSKKIENANTSSPICDGTGFCNPPEYQGATFFSMINEARPDAFIQFREDYAINKNCIFVVNVKNK